MAVTNVIGFVSGKTGTGKSYCLNYILRREYELKRREGIVILDLQGDHVNLLREQKFFYLPMGKKNYDTYRFNWVGILQKYPYIIIEPQKFSGEDYGNLADDIAGAIMEIGNRTFVIEESHFAMPTNNSMKHHLSALITTGRKLGIDLYFTSQRPALVNTTAVTQANLRIGFFVDDPNDMKRMNGFFADYDLSKLAFLQFVANNNRDRKVLKGDNNHLSELDSLIWGI
jgi:DNA helicase HerA-like ATPase